MSDVAEQTAEAESQGHGLAQAASSSPTYVIKDDGMAARELYLGQDVSPIFRHFLEEQMSLHPAGNDPALRVLDAGGGSNDDATATGSSAEVMARVTRLRWQLLTLKKYLCSK